jgi:hypothetical protein
MNNELPIGSVISYKKNVWDERDIPDSGRATIIGYDICHSKYHAIKHRYDDIPMPGVKLWLFSNEIENHP